MAFHWYQEDDIGNVDLNSIILTSLSTEGGWEKFDPGYNIIRDPSNRFELNIELEVTNYRYLQMKIGEYGSWSTGTHSFIGTVHTWGHLIYEVGGLLAGTGNYKLSFDNNHLILITDYKADQPTYGRRCLSYCGLCNPLDPTDEVLVGGSTLYRGGSYTVPTNDVSSGQTELNVMRDISGSATKPRYQLASVYPFDTNAIQTYGIAKMQIQSAKIDKRYLFPVYLCSNSTYPTGGEDAGFRAQFYDMFLGGYYDGISHGQVLRADDNKEYFYYVYENENQYCHLPLYLLVRRV